MSPTNANSGGSTRDIRSKVAASGSNGNSGTSGSNTSAAAAAAGITSQTAEQLKRSRSQGTRNKLQMMHTIHQSMMIMPSSASISAAATSSAAARDHHHHPSHHKTTARAGHGSSTSSAEHIHGSYESERGTLSNFSPRSAHFGQSHSIDRTLPRTASPLSYIHYHQLHHLGGPIGSGFCAFYYLFQFSFLASLTSLEPRLSFVVYLIDLFDFCFYFLFNS